VARYKSIERLVKNSRKQIKVNAYSDYKYALSSKMSTEISS